MKLFTIQKGVEFEWKDQEDVYTFKKAGISKFLKSMLLKNAKYQCSSMGDGIEVRSEEMVHN